MRRTQALALTPRRSGLKEAPLLRGPLSDRLAVTLLTHFQALIQRRAPASFKRAGTYNYKETDCYLIGVLSGGVKKPETLQNLSKPF